MIVGPKYLLLMGLELIPEPATCVVTQKSKNILSNYRRILRTFLLARGVLQATFDSRCGAAPLRQGLAGRRV
jgi:hypothetical protein